tara:strand:- start:409 stop:819 length:411 start_codon:yes stop_codon:yes gene_type:complete
LQVDFGGSITDILNTGRSREQGINLIKGASVGHQVEQVIGKSEGHTIIDNATLIIENGTVSAQTNPQTEHVTENQSIEGLRRFGATEQELAHVGAIEESGLRAGVLMFLNYSGELDRKGPAVEIDDFGTLGVVGAS